MDRHRRRLGMGFAAWAGIAAAGCAAQPRQRDSTQPATRYAAGEHADETLTVSGATRRFRLFVPTRADAAAPLPLVVALHGMAIDSKDLMPRYTRLNESAQRHGFAVAYPNAVGGSFGLAPAKIVADLAMFDALVTLLARRLPLDAERIHVLGMSNGGYFAHLVAKERSTIIAAAASHSGPLGLQTLGGIHAARKFPVFIAHGAQDRLFPVGIARENVQKYRREGHEAEYLEVADLGHAWAPDASEAIWRFFARHPRAHR